MQGTTAHRHVSAVAAPSDIIMIVPLGVASAAGSAIMIAVQGGRSGCATWARSWRRWSAGGVRAFRVLAAGIGGLGSP